MADELLKVTCPHCNESLNIRKPGKAGKHKVRCPKCEQAFIITVKDTQTPNADITLHPQKQDAAAMREVVRDEPTIRPQLRSKESSDEDEPNTRFLKQRGVILNLYRKRSFFMKDERIDLHVGDNVIGVECEDAPSDIMIADSYMSRRSVSIQVEMADGDTFKYKFTLLRSSNPVTYNKKTILPGTSKMMRDGDTFTIGKTTFYMKSV